MEFSTHYLLMADHSMLQKLVMSRIKPLGLTTGQPKVLDFLQDHDGAMQKDIAKGCHIEPSYYPRGNGTRRTARTQHTR